MRFVAVTKQYICLGWLSIVIVRIIEDTAVLLALTKFADLTADMESNCVLRPPPSHTPRDPGIVLKHGLTRIVLDSRVDVSYILRRLEGQLLMTNMNFRRVKESNVYW